VAVALLAGCGAVRSPCAIIGRHSESGRDAGTEGGRAEPFDMRIIRLSLPFCGALLLGAAPAAPIRHLEYAFATQPTASETKGPFNGTLSVNVLGLAPDGGILVRMTERLVSALDETMTPS